MMFSSRLRARLGRALSGKKLFLKIFLWFWLTVLVILSVIFIKPRLNSVQVITPPNINAAIAPILAAQAVRAYETGGPKAFAQYAHINVESTDHRLFLLDGEYRDVLGGRLPRNGETVARLAKTGKVILFRSHIAVYKLIAGSGKPYILLLFLNEKTLGGIVGRTTWKEVPYLGAVLCAVTLWCYLLARHIAAPMLEMQEIARRVSQGDLRARAPAALIERRDEMRDLAVDFNTMVDRVEALLHTHKRLLAYVSHEVRSPLTRLAVTVALLRRHERGGTAALLDRIDREIAPMDVLMGQVLTVARLEGREHRGRLATVELGHLLEELVADAGFEAESEGKQVLLSRTADISLRQADGSAVRSALENIIRNATRYSPPGSIVRVELKEQQTDGAGRAARITVCDEGPGVPPEHLHEIFQPFFRVPAVQENGTPSGNGLGLAIAAEAISLHKGSITARNRDKAGLEVQVLLPVAGQASPHS